MNGEPMAPREYRTSRRAETAAETRRRLVEATFALHAEQGIAATSMKQIARRAGVSIGAAYHHFPTYEDAILACGRHAAETAPPPDARIFEGLASVAERVRRLAREVFRHYDRLPAFERVRCDQHLLPVLRRFVEAEERHRSALVREALRPPPGGAAAAALEERRVRLATALLDLGVCRALQRAGFTTGEAAEEVARLILVPPAGDTPPPDEPPA
jgi:AcrR family transcriptional regulator